MFWYACTCTLTCVHACTLTCVHACTLTCVHAWLNNVQAVLETHAAHAHTHCLDWGPPEWLARWEWWTIGDGECLHTISDEYVSTGYHVTDRYDRSWFFLTQLTTDSMKACSVTIALISYCKSSLGVYTTIIQLTCDLVGFGLGLS